jgi:hypothetical protein
MSSCQLCLKFRQPSDADDMSIHAHAASQRVKTGRGGLGHYHPAARGNFMQVAESGRKIAAAKSRRKFIRNSCRPFTTTYH